MVHFGEGTMSGYWRDPELTRERMIANGSAVGVLTGDHFAVQPNGQFRFIGRKDDLVKRMDHRVSLREIEVMIRDSQLVEDVCVVAFAGKTRWGGDGQRIVALFRAAGDVGTELEAFCRQSMSPPKVPDEFRRVDHFPLTASAKPDRQMLLRTLGVSPEPAL